MTQAPSTSRHIGEVVQLLRAERGWTQSELAQKAGLHMRTVQDVERDLTQPRLATCVRLARALDVSVKELIDRNGGS